jgi:carbon storage regulator
VLIFTRRVGEEIRINDDIRVRIIDIKGKQVRLGIEAPPEIIVHREEIYLRINENNFKNLEAGSNGDNVTEANGPAEIDQEEEIGPRKEVA